MTSNKTPAAEMHAAIIASLGLDKNTIIFHMLDGVLASGSVFENDDLETSDAFLALADDCDSMPVVQVSNVTTYMIGSGESYNATDSDIDFLANLRDGAPAVFDDMLYEYADILASIDDLEVINPYYTEEEE